MSIITVERDRSRIMDKRIILMLCCFFIHVSAQPSATKKLVIFIHGSLGSGLAFLNPHRALYDNFLENSYYIRVIKSIREDPFLFQDQVMLGLGLQKVSLNDFHANTLHGVRCKQAAYYVIGAYDSCVQRCRVPEDCSYFTFGHFGLLSQKYRKEVASQLYHALCEQVERYQKEYEQVDIDIIAHSHGGNIALNLYAAESVHQRSLQINTLFLLGTPIQHETAPFVHSDFFKRVISCYSDGDYLQGKDCISTAHRRSYKTFKKAGYSNVSDIRLLVNKSRKRVGHANMWLMGKGGGVCDILGHLPVVVLVPFIMKLHEDIQGSDLDCHIHEDGNKIHIGLSEHKKKNVQLECCDNIEYMSDRVQSWSPDDRSQHPFFNNKLLEIIKKIFKCWSF